MTQIQFLFIITFLFGTLRLLSTINIFKIILEHPYELISEREEYDEDNHWIVNLLLFLNNSLHWASNVFFYFCLYYQIWFWFIYICNIV